MTTLSHHDIGSSEKTAAFQTGSENNGVSTEIGARSSLQTDTSKKAPLAASKPEMASDNSALDHDAVHAGAPKISRKKSTREGHPHGLAANLGPISLYDDDDDEGYHGFTI